MTAVPELALTLIQPMGWAIVAGHKAYENRLKNIMPKALRGKRTRVAIHNGAKWDDAYAATVKRLCGTCPTHAPMPAVIGVATFTGRIHTSFDPPSMSARGFPWFTGPFSYEIDLAESVLFSEPVECRGALGFWKLDNQTYDRVGYELARKAA